MSDTPQDRGDSLSADEVAAADAAKVAETAVAEVKVAETKVAEDDTAAGRDDKGRFTAAIPKARFDEAVNKERDARLFAERQLADLQAQLQQVDRHADAQKLEADIVELEKAHASALLKGDVDGAAETAAKIRMMERTISIQGATHLSAQAKDQAREEVRMDAAIEKLEQSYDVLNPEKQEVYDQGLVNLILASQRYLIDNERLLPSAALVKATEEVMGRFGKAAPAAGAGLKAGTKAGDRQQSAVDRALAAAGKQPASLKDAGLDSDKAGMVRDVDVSKLSMEEFAALPDATKSRLRGDMLDA